MENFHQWLPPSRESAGLNEILNLLHGELIGRKMSPQPWAFSLVFPATVGEASSLELPELICTSVSHKLWLDIYSSHDPGGIDYLGKEWSRDDRAAASLKIGPCHISSWRKRGLESGKEKSAVKCRSCPCLRGVARCSYSPSLINQPLLYSCKKHAITQELLSRNYQALPLLFSCFCVVFMRLRTVEPVLVLAACWWISTPAAINCISLIQVMNWFLCALSVGGCSVHARMVGAMGRSLVPAVFKKHLLITVQVQMERPRAGSRHLLRFWLQSGETLLMRSRELSGTATCVTVNFSSVWEVDRYKLDWLNCALAQMSYWFCVTWGLNYLSKLISPKYY